MNFPGLADPYPPKPQQTGGCLLRIASHASHSDGDGNCHALLEVMQWEGGACVTIKWQILQIHLKIIRILAKYYEIICYPIFQP